MKTLTVLCNIVLAAYIVFSVLLVLVPLATVFALVRAGAVPGWLGHATAVSNLALAALVVWAIVDQYPHPAEPGFLEFVAVAVATPLLSAWILFRTRTTPAAAH